MTKDANLRIYQVLNIVGLILVLIMNYLAVNLPLGGKTTGELSAMYPNLFTPAGFTFSIWGIIYLALIVFIVLQSKGLFTADVIPHYVQDIGPWFFLNTLANAGWLLAWHYQYLGISLVIMLAILTTLIIINDKLESGGGPSSTMEYYGVHVPFQIYFGWITVATVANATAVLVGYNWNAWGIQPEVWTVTMLAIVLALGLIILIQRRYYFYNFVLIWACIGVMARQNADPQVLSVVIAAVGVIVVLTIGLLYTRFRMS